MGKSATQNTGSGLQPSGAVGFANVINVDDDIPEGYKPAVVYKNARGKFVDPFGREVTDLGTLQEAGVSGTTEQKASTQYNEPLPDAEQKKANETDAVEQAGEDHSQDA